MSKVRIYKLARNLKLDIKRVMEEVGRLGYDVSTPSHSIPDDVAEKIKNKFSPAKELQS